MIPNKTLHYSLHDEMIQLTTSTFTDTITTIQIKNYISNVLLFATSIIDISTLLPKVFAPAFNDIPREVREHIYCFTEQSEQNIQAFIIKHQDDLNCLKAYIFTQFLTAE